jgi:tricorn protease
VTGEVSNITNNDAQDIFPMWYGNNVYFVSDRDRTMNLFVYETASGQTRKLTNYTEYDIKFPSLGNNAIIYENGGYLYIFDLKTETASKMSIIIAEDFYGGRNELKDASKSSQGLNHRRMENVSFFQQGERSFLFLPKKGSPET